MIKPPNHGTVVAYAALVVALSSGGAAFAASQIGAKDIKPDAVRSKHIKDGHVRTQDLALDAVTGAQVANDSLSGDDIAESTLGTVPNASALAGRGAGSFATSSVYKVEATTDAGTRLGDNTNTKSKACDPGDILLAGGPASVNPTSDLLESFPTPGTTNSWSARIIDNGVADSFTVVVLCLNQTP
ncbi:hypothetical protein [Nocardioides sp.]|jgi:hypothetical protein|uniref:hypothetical protein n=1 Tax=Nocardioides sp. TaxID=35761 RepID=UPI0031FF0A97|nr:hypothetical protein [Nocardioides sp.]